MHDLFCSLKIPKSIDYIHYFLSVLMLEGDGFIVDVKI